MWLKHERKKRKSWFSKILGVTAMVSFNPVTVVESIRMSVVSPAMSPFQYWPVVKSDQNAVVSPGTGPFHAWLGVRVAVTSSMFQCNSLTQAICFSASRTCFSFPASVMASTPQMRSGTTLIQGRTWRWPVMSADESERLRGSRCNDWAADAALYKDTKGSPWKHIDPQPSNPHALDEPIRLWMAQRGLDWRLGLDPEQMFLQLHHTYGDEDREMIVLTKHPRSLEKVKRIRDARAEKGTLRICYHGTTAYAAPNLVVNGPIASENEDLGHTLLSSEKGGNLPGIYVTPYEVTSFMYAYAHILFRDTDAGEGDEGQFWVRFVIEVLVDLDKRRGKNTPGKNKLNVQWVFNEKDVEVIGIKLYTNFPPRANDGRIRAWQRHLELTPDPALTWGQIQKVNGKWATGAVRPKPQAPPGPPPQKADRANLWPENDSLLKMLCVRCGFATGFDDPQDKTKLLCRRQPCEEYPEKCTKVSVHPAFQRNKQKSASSLASQKTSRASSPANSIVDSRRHVGDSSGLDSEKKGKGVGLRAQPQTPEDHDGARSSAQPAKHFMKPSPKASSTRYLALLHTLRLRHPTLHTS